MSTPKKVIVICGPTAVGKTSVAIEVARLLDTAIISADSRQCFHELNIGVARPSPAELAAVPHYFIASHSIHDVVTAASFEKYALEITHRLFKQHDHVVMVGGTGLYIKAFCEGMDPIPDSDHSLREEILSNYQQYGMKWLQDEITIKDPLFLLHGEMKNPQRIMRALEVKEMTGQSIIELQKGQKVTRDFEIVKIGLELPRTELVDRINKRVDVMMADGLVDEVKRLVPYRNLNALQTVGYTEIFRYLDGEWTLSQAIDAIKTATRQYAKRQMTWFRRDPAVIWRRAEDAISELQIKTNN